MMCIELKIVSRAVCGIYEERKERCSGLLNGVSLRRNTVAKEQQNVEATWHGAHSIASRTQCTFFDSPTWSTTTQMNIVKQIVGIIHALPK
jgi:hypothetical protein